MWAGFAAYLGAVIWAPRLGRRLFWGLVVGLLVLFASLPPLLSHDVYSYIDYARLGALHGVDPYVDPPAVVPSDPAFAHVEWTDATSAYGPLFTLASYPLAWLPIDVAVHVLKAISAGAVLGTALLVARLAPTRGIEPLRAAAFVALNPLVLVHVVGGPHNDSLAVLLVTLGVAGMLAARETSAGAAFGGAVAIKASAFVVAPFALLASLPRPNRFFVGVGLGTVAIGAAAYAAFGWSWLDAFALAEENQGRTSYMSIPITAARLAASTRT